MKYIAFTDSVEIMDSFRMPVNKTERAARIAGKTAKELYPYYGATGQAGVIDGYLVDGEYVLLGEDGAPFLDAYATKAYLINGKAWINNHAHILKSKTNNKFLCYYLNYFNYKGFVSGTTRLKLTQADMKRIPIPDFSLEEQARIVARIEELFSELDAGVKTLQTIKQQLTVYQQALISASFAEADGLDSVRLDEISVITGGITKGRDLTGKDVIELPYLRVANVQNGYLDLSEMKMIQLCRDEKAKYLLQYGDVLFTEGGDRDKLGRGTIWRNEKARIDKGKAIPEYIAYWAMSTPARNYFYEKGKQSVNLASINKTILSALTLPLPDIGTQKRIIEHIQSRLSNCKAIEQAVDTVLQQSAAMRQSILKQAFKEGL